MQTGITVENITNADEIASSKRRHEYSESQVLASAESTELLAFFPVHAHSRTVIVHPVEELAKGLWCAATDTRS